MNYTIFTGGEKNDLFDFLMEDLKTDSRVELINKLPAIPKNLQLLWRLHHKWALPFRQIWYSYTPFSEDKLRNGSHCLIFNNISVGHFESSLLKKWKKKYNIKLVLYLLDVYDSYYCKSVRQIVKQIPFDEVFTFYQEDAKNHGFTYFDTYFSGIPVTPSEKKSDLFFWGTDCGRRDMVETISDIFTKEGLQTNVGICYTDEENHKPGIVYNEPLPYPKVVEHIQSSRCILDLVSERSKGVSLRYYEAMVYGKKLITNNPLVKNMRGYDPCQVFLFDKPQEIDPAFLDLPYDGKKENMFSPIHWIDSLDFTFHEST